MNPYFKTVLLSSITILLTILLIYFPDAALSASLRGLKMWAEVVFPSLLPFFITAELLLAFGVVKFLGVLFEPIMRPLFNVPGVGSFGWIMGMASGYPTGAKIAARLREEKQLTKLEAERLVAFTNNSSPLFIFGAISIGFFHDVKLGMLLAVCHYLSNMLVGILMRFHGRKAGASEKKPAAKKIYKPSIKAALGSMHRTRLKDGRPIGEILGDSVLQSIKTLIMVGGFIILFSVIIQLLHLVHFSVFIGNIFSALFYFIGIPIHFGEAFFSGLFEITLGATLISQFATDSLLHKSILVSFILGFNGFSIQAQVASILAKTDIRFTPYFFARFLHGLIAAILTVLLYRPLYLNRQQTELTSTPAVSESHFWEKSCDILFQNGPLITIFFLSLSFILLLNKKRRDGQ